MEHKAADLNRSLKAARLVAEGEITRLSGARAYRVPGEKAPWYTVVLSDEADLCDCEHGRRQQGVKPHCSHVIAVVLEENRPADPFVGLPSEEYPNGRPR